MSEIIVIVAIAENNVIGKDNQIPWYIKEDFMHFKAKTTGHTCIMGSKTWESLPTKPLPNRKNIVLYPSMDYDAPGATVYTSFEEAIEETKSDQKVFIIGGASIYKLGLEVADTLELTRVHMKPEGDTYFPEINFDEWKLVNEDNNDKYSFLTYKRKSL